MQRSKGKKPTSPQTNRKNDFFEALPSEFDRQKAIEIGAKFNIPIPSIDRYLKEFKKVGQNQYKK